MVVLVTSADLWVSKSQYERSEVKLSPLGGRGQCEGGQCHQCEELQRVEGRLRPPSHHLHVFLIGMSLYSNSKASNLYFQVEFVVMNRLLLF